MRTPTSGFVADSAVSGYIQSRCPPPSPGSVPPPCASGRTGLPGPSVVFAETSVGFPASSPADRRGPSRCPPQASGGAVPDDSRLPLVGNPHRRQIPGRHTGRGKRIPDHRLDTLKDLHRIMFDPTRPGEDPEEFPLGRGNHPPGVVEDHEPGAGGSLVDGSYRSPVSHPAKTVASWVVPVGVAGPRGQRRGRSLRSPRRTGSAALPIRRWRGRRKRPELRRLPTRPCR